MSDSTPSVDLKSDLPSRAPLINELRRVDSAFAQLKAGHDDEVEALLDTDRVVRGANRPRLGVAVAALACAVVVAVSVVAGRTDSLDRAVDPALDTLAQAPTVRGPPPVQSPSVTVAAMPTPPQTPAPPTGPAPLKLIDVDVDGVQPLAPPHALDGLALTVAVNPLVLQSPRAQTSVASGVNVGAALDLVADDEVQASLEQVRALRARGTYHDAAAVLGSLLARKAAPRVADSLGYERALLLSRAHDDVAACAALHDHANRFPNSDNATDVLSRLSSCP